MTMRGSDLDKENLEISENFGEKIKVNDSNEKEEGGNDEEFSFVCTNPDGSLIRPIFPIFDQSLLYRDGEGDTDSNLKKDSQSSLRPPLKKLFMEEPAGPFCDWSSSNKTVKEASSEACKKSNSTGFSKLWRFRDLVLRSNSDGKDAFVSLNNSHQHYNMCDSEKPENNSEMPEKSSEKPEKRLTIGKTSTTQKTGNRSEKSGSVKAETVSSMYEKHYLRNCVMREGDKHKSYSPYRHDRVGFFINVNGLTRNVHPF